MDESRLRPPRSRPRPIPRTANAQQAPTPEQLARLNLRRAIQRARLVLPDDLARYVARHLDGRESVASDALSTGSIEDLRAYQTLATLALRSHRTGGLRRDDPIRRMLRGFRVELLPGTRSGHPHLESPRFTLHRTRKTAA